MLREYTPPERDIHKYQPFVTAEALAALFASAERLAGKRIVHVNATPRGGGVAELLRALVPLQRSVGLDSHWYSLEDDRRIFLITKKLHDALQGSPEELTTDERRYYLDYSKNLAADITKERPDLLVVHDPQPLAAHSYCPGIPAVARLHIDLTAPNTATLHFIKPFLAHYRAVAFSLPEYVPPFLAQERIVVSPPAIDPLDPKNIPLPENEQARILRALGLDLNRPIVTQVSRFEIWKDPLGVIEAFALLRETVPNAQLVLMGVIEAQDDPNAEAMLYRVRASAASLESARDDIHLLAHPEDFHGIDNSQAVNALQSASAVIMQKSLREGFGLTVSEAMWKEKAVIGGDAGGIRLQIRDGENGFLVRSPAQAAQRALTLLNDPRRAAAMGVRAHEYVRRHFLITRLLADELSLLERCARQ
jgi:trehalose synthase